MITFLRSLIFNILYIFWTPFIGLVMMPLALISHSDKAKRISPVIWAKGIIILARVILGIRYEVRGQQYLKTDSAVIYASKHQSAWETVVFWLLVKSPVYVLKKELLNIPVFGQYLGFLLHTISVDRSAGLSAIKNLVADSKKHLASNRQIILFPEGTRRPVGSNPEYQAGVSALYSQLGDDVEIVPVALNSGVLWGRNAFIKKSGLITIEFLPPMEKGLSRKEFNKTLQDRIEEASEKLLYSENDCNESH